MYPAVVALFALLSKWGNAWSSPEVKTSRVVDLTHVFDNTTLNYPGLRDFELNSFIAEISGARIQLEEYSSSTHAGTHINSPCLFIPGGDSVNEIPMDKLIAPAAVVDIRHKAASNPDSELTIDDLLDWERTTGVLLNDVILLVRSGWSRFWSCNTTAYIGTDDNNINNLHFPGMAPSAALWLVKNRHVYGVGVETLTVDYGPGSARGFPASTILHQNNIYFLECVDDMSKLPLFGAALHVMPMKIGAGACGAPTRVVATFPGSFGTDYRSGH